MLPHLAPAFKSERYNKASDRNPLTEVKEMWVLNYLSLARHAFDRDGDSVSREISCSEAGACQVDSSLSIMNLLPMPKAKSSTRKSTNNKILISIPSWMNEVTPFSKALAMIIFVLFPFLGFWMGARLQRELMGVYPPFEVVVRQGCSAPMEYKRGELKQSVPEGNPDGLPPTPQQ